MSFNPENHQPEFKWVVGDDGEKRILDGDLPVATFRGALNDGSRQAFKPIALHDLRLSPGAPAIIAKGESCGPLCLSWRKHLMFRMEIDELTADDSDPERFRLTLKCQDAELRDDQADLESYRPGLFAETINLELTYDDASGGYVFNVKTSLSTPPERWREALARGHGGLEFADILPAGANDQFPPNGAKRFHHVLYMAEDGRILDRPQNHHFGVDKMDILFAADGFLAFVAEPGDNPAMEFFDGSGSDVFSEICWAMYDVHFKVRAESQRARLSRGEPLTVRYRFRSLTETEARAALDESKPDPILDDSTVKSPVYVPGVNRFEPSTWFRQPTDKWFWRASDPCCVWDWEIGLSTPGSPRISRPAAHLPEFRAGLDKPWMGLSSYCSDGTTRSQWEAHTVASYPGTPPMAERYVVKAKVKCENVVGEAKLAWQYHAPDRDVEFSESLSGTTDWTELVLKTTPSDGSVRASLFLVLEGKGECRFDEVEAMPTPDA